MPRFDFSRDRPPDRKYALNDVERLCLYVAQHLFGIASDRKGIRYARRDVTGMFPNLPPAIGMG
ncbi:hypothetical protein [Kocuria sp. CPCC 205233]|uniref:hypothetical protein n=1 Tax=Kocuria sp. CPCC 205233 TaxID=3073550 RepID=UPI0034D73AE6